MVPMNYKMPLSRPFWTPEATATNSQKRANLLAGKTDLSY